MQLETLDAIDPGLPATDRRPGPIRRRTGDAAR